MKYIPNTTQDQKQMLDAIGVSSINALFDDIPVSLQLKKNLNLDKGMCESEINMHMEKLAAANTFPRVSYLGAGVYNHYIPAVVDAITGRSEFYTAYTPYQPEISQGMLQSIFEYQSMICSLTGMDVTNASMYDGSTALAEAAVMSSCITGRHEVLVADTVHPEYREVLNTYCKTRGITIVTIPHKSGVVSLEHLQKLISDRTAGVIIQNPNFFGSIENPGKLETIIHAAGALFIVNVVNTIALGLLNPPGAYNTDIVAGEGQSLGNPANYGGPHLGILACKTDFMRKMPGRIAGLTKDQQGRQGFVLTLQAREQHIRREQAVSNICSNQALCALAAAVYMSALGKQGFKQAAELCYHKSHYLYNKLVTLPGFSPAWDSPFFNEFTIKTPGSETINNRLLDNGIIGGYDLSRAYPGMDNCLLFCVNELHSRDDLDTLIKVLS